MRVEVRVRVGVDVLVVEGMVLGVAEGITLPTARFIQLTMMIPVIMITENFKNVTYDALYVLVFTMSLFHHRFSLVSREMSFVPSRCVDISGRLCVRSAH